jgi:hypothetical protein
VKCKIQNFLSRFNPKVVKITGVIGGGIAVMGLFLLVFYVLFDDDPTEAANNGVGTMPLVSDSDEVRPSDEIPEEDLGGYAHWSVVVDEDGNYFVYDENGELVEDVLVYIDEEGFVWITDLDGNILAKMPDDIILLSNHDPDNPIFQPIVTDSSGNIIPPDSTTKKKDDKDTDRTTTTKKPAPGDPPPIPDVIEISLNGNKAITTNEPLGKNGKHKMARINNKGNVVTIRRPGNYVISGTLNDGQIVVNTNENNAGQNGIGERGKGRKGIVRITLNNASINNSSGPAIRTAHDGGTDGKGTNAGMQLIIVNAPGTKNRLVDSRPARPDDVGDNEEEVDNATNRNAALFSRFPLTVTGSGELTVVGGFAHGIHSRFDLFVTGNTRINVERAHVHGLRSRYRTTIDTATVRVSNAGGRGIRSTGNQHGRVDIRNAKINIRSFRDGIDSSNNLNITNSDVELLIDGGFGDGRNEQGISKRGIRADGNLNITGGTIVVNSINAALSAGGDVTVKDVKSMTLTTGGHGMRARSAMITDSTVEITISNNSFTIGRRNNPGVLEIQRSNVNVHFRARAFNLEHNSQHKWDIEPKNSHCTGCH